MEITTQARCMWEEAYAWHWTVYGLVMLMIMFLQVCHIWQVIFLHDRLQIKPLQHSGKESPTHFFQTSYFYFNEKET